jgi:hypothetical protein
MGSLTVSLTPSLNPKMTLTKFLRHVTRVSVYFFIFIFSIIFIFYLHICVYILSAEPVHKDSTRSSLNPCFFVRHFNFRDVYSLKKEKKIHTARSPHVRRTFTARAAHVRLCGEFTAQPHVRCGILGSTHLSYTGLLVEPEHLKIETRFIDEMFSSVMGEYLFLCLFIMNQ